MALDQWLPAAVGLIGGLIAYLLGWRERQKESKRFVTNDALTALESIVNAQKIEIAAAKTAMQEAKAAEQSCKQALATLREELNESRQEVFDLRLEVHQLRQAHT